MGENKQKSKWELYEEYKEWLREQNLTAEEYMERIKEYCEREGI